MDKRNGNMTAIFWGGPWGGVPGGARFQHQGRAQKESIPTLTMRPWGGPWGPRRHRFGEIVQERPVSKLTADTSLKSGNPRFGEFIQNDEPSFGVVAENSFGKGQPRVGDLARKFPKFRKNEPTSKSIAEGSPSPKQSRSGDSTIYNKPKSEWTMTCWGGPFGERRPRREGQVNDNNNTPKPEAMIPRELTRNRKSPHKISSAQNQPGLIPTTKALSGTGGQAGGWVTAGHDVLPSAIPMELSLRSEIQGRDQDNIAQGELASPVIGEELSPRGQSHTTIVSNTPSYIVTSEVLSKQEQIQSIITPTEPGLVLTRELPGGEHERRRGSRSRPLPGPGKPSTPKQGAAQQGDHQGQNRYTSKDQPILMPVQRALAKRREQGLEEQAQIQNAHQGRPIVLSAQRLSPVEKKEGNQDIEYSHPAPVSTYRVRSSDNDEKSRDAAQSKLIFTPQELLHSSSGREERPEASRDNPDPSFKPLSCEGKYQYHFERSIHNEQNGLHLGTMGIAPSPKGLEKDPDGIQEERVIFSKTRPNRVEHDQCKDTHNVKQCRIDSALTCSAGTEPKQPQAMALSNEPELNLNNRLLPHARGGHREQDIAYEETNSAPMRSSNRPTLTDEEGSKHSQDTKHIDSKEPKFDPAEEVLPPDVELKLAQSTFCDISDSTLMKVHDQPSMEAQEAGRSQSAVDDTTTSAASASASQTPFSIYDQSTHPNSSRRGGTVSDECVQLVISEVLLNKRMKQPHSPTSSKKLELELLEVFFGTECDEVRLQRHENDRIILDGCRRMIDDLVTSEKGMPKLQPPKDSGPLRATYERETPVNIGTSDEALEPEENQHLSTSDTKAVNSTSKSNATKKLAPASATNLPESIWSRVGQTTVRDHPFPSPKLTSNPANGIFESAPAKNPQKNASSNSPMENKMRRMGQFSFSSSLSPAAAKDFTSSMSENMLRPIISSAPTKAVSWRRQSSVRLASPVEEPVSDTRKGGPGLRSQPNCAPASREDSWSRRVVPARVGDATSRTKDTQMPQVIGLSKITAPAVWHSPFRCASRPDAAKDPIPEDDEGWEPVPNSLFEENVPWTVVKSSSKGQSKAASEGKTKFTWQSRMPNPSTEKKLKVSNGLNEDLSSQSWRDSGDSSLQGATPELVARGESNFLEVKAQKLDRPLSIHPENQFEVLVTETHVHDSKEEEEEEEETDVPDEDTQILTDRQPKVKSKKQKWKLKSRQRTKAKNAPRGSVNRTPASTAVNTFDPQNTINAQVNNMGDSAGVMRSRDDALLTEGYQEVAKNKAAQGAEEFSDLVTPGSEGCWPLEDLQSSDVGEEIVTPGTTSSVIDDREEIVTAIDDIQIGQVDNSEALTTHKLGSEKINPLETINQATALGGDGRAIKSPSPMEGFEQVAKDKVAGENEDGAVSMDLTTGTGFPSAPRLGDFVTQRIKLALAEGRFEDADGDLQPTSERDQAVQGANFWVQLKEEARERAARMVPQVVHEATAVELGSDTKEVELSEEDRSWIKAVPTTFVFAYRNALRSLSDRNLSKEERLQKFLVYHTRSWHVLVQARSRPRFVEHITRLADANGISLRTQDYHFRQFCQIASDLTRTVRGVRIFQEENHVEQSQQLYQRTNNKTILEENKQRLRGHVENEQPALSFLVQQAKAHLPPFVWVQLCTSNPELRHRNVEHSQLEYPTSGNSRAGNLKLGNSELIQLAQTLHYRDIRPYWWPGQDLSLDTEGFEYLNSKGYNTTLKLFKKWASDPNLQYSYRLQAAEFLCRALDEDETYFPSIDTHSPKLSQYIRSEERKESTQSTMSATTVDVPLPVLPEGWSGEKDFKAIGKISLATQRSIEPVGPHFLAHARRARHKRTFSEDDRIQAQENAKKVEDDDSGEISEAEDPHMLLRDAKDWKAQDHYAVMGLSKYRWRATEEQIKRAHRKKVLRHHPDKKAAAGSTEDDNFFKCIQKAHEILLDPVKRRQFDSVDEAADIEPPTKKQLKDSGKFYKLWGNVFKAEGRFSRIQPVPKFGDDNSTEAEVEAFYNFFYSFDSWRSFEYQDEDVPDDNENRDQKRHVEKKNNNARKKKKTEDSARLRKLVETVQASDERIKRFRQAKNADKNKKRLEKEAAEKKAIEDAKVAKEAEAKAAKEAEEKAKAEKEQGKKVKEAAKAAVKKNRRIMKGSVKDANYFANGEAGASAINSVLSDVELIQGKIDADETADLAGKLNGLKVADDIKGVWAAEVQRLIGAGKIKSGDIKALI